MYGNKAGKRKSDCMIRFIFNNADVRMMGEKFTNEVVNGLELDQRQRQQG